MPDGFFVTGKRERGFSERGGGGNGTGAIVAPLFESVKESRGEPVEGFGKDPGAVIGEQEEEILPVGSQPVDPGEAGIAIEPVHSAGRREGGRV